MVNRLFWIPLARLLPGFAAGVLHRMDRRFEVFHLLMRFFLVPSGFFPWP
jgi:hypothetical protein